MQEYLDTVNEAVPNWALTGMRDIDSERVLSPAAGVDEEQHPVRLTRIANVLKEMWSATQLTALNPPPPCRCTTGQVRWNLKLVFRGDGVDARLAHVHVMGSAVEAAEFGKETLVADGAKPKSHVSKVFIVEHEYLGALPYPYPSEQARLPQYKTWREQDLFFVSKMGSFVELDKEAWALGGVLQPEGVNVFQRLVRSTFFFSQRSVHLDLCDYD